MTVDQLEQGDVLRCGNMPLMHSDKQDIECPDGVVVISQTCDAIRRDRIQVAKIVHLNEIDAKDAAKGKRPRYIPLTALGPDMFADLDFVATLDCPPKQRLVLYNGQSVKTYSQKQLFRELIGRRFARFPFPDGVVTWCRPLQATATKSRKQGAQGELLRRIDCIRIGDENRWEDPDEYELTIYFLISDDGDNLPAYDKSAPHTPVNMKKEEAQYIAEALVRQYELVPTDGFLINDLWQKLVNVWIDSCNVRYRQSNSKVRVHGSGVVELTSDFTYVDYTETEQLDFDYLSR